jgi:hypothetical protein
MHIPFAVLALIPFVVGLAILTSGHDLAQQIVFGIMALIVLAVQLLGAVWMFSSRLQGRSTESTILQLIDSYTGLVMAWGMGCVALWLINDHRYLQANLGHIEESHWLVAVQFTCLAIEHSIASSHDIQPIHLVSEMYFALISAFHLFYTLAVLAAGIEAYAEHRKKGREEVSEDRQPLQQQPPTVAYAMHPIGHEFSS